MSAGCMSLCTLPGVKPNTYYDIIHTKGPKLEASILYAAKNLRKCVVFENTVTHFMRHSGAAGGAKKLTHCNVFKADIVVPEHESSIFRSFIHPTLYVVLEVPS